MIKFGDNATYQSQFKERLAMIRQWCHEDKGLWDLLTCTRGPDSPSERGDGSGSANQSAYKARRERKYRTGEVIRGVSGLNAGAARNRVDDKVILPPRDEWDHYDRHVCKAVEALERAGFQIRIEIEKKQDAKKDERGRYAVGVVIADPDGYKPGKEDAGLGASLAQIKKAATGAWKTSMPAPIWWVQVGPNQFVKASPGTASVMVELSSAANNGNHPIDAKKYEAYAAELKTNQVVYSPSQIFPALQNKYVYAPNCLYWAVSTVPGALADTAGAGSYAVASASNG